MIAAALAGLVGGVVAAGLAPLAIRRAPARLVRTNVEGRPVPAVLGVVLVVASLAALAATAAAAAIGLEEASTGRVGLATAFVLVVMGSAGAWDDLKGDERPRGFKGHLGEARMGKLTGGSLKLVAGGVAGLGAGAIVPADGGAVVAIGLIVALSANLVNLFDRAPGRAGKIGLAWSVPLLLLAPEPWTVGAAGVIGALAVCLVPDLRARAMLGDAGANPIGAVLGLGTALSLGSGGRIAAVLVLTAINLASERWSFSTLIEGSAALRALDRLGRPSRK